MDKNYFSSAIFDYNNDLAYCCTNTEEIANHAVTIVGWDDNYENASFPGKKGAYKVLNSYGLSFGDNGLYYILYDDIFIKDAVLYGVMKTDDIDYDNIYQYDEYGCVSNITMSSSIYAANVFKRKNTSEKEQLTEISLNVPMSQRVEIYINAENNNTSITSANKQLTTEILDKGYHTIKLDNPITLTGNEFVVIVKYSNKLPIERMADSSLSWCYTATSKNGESYISSNRKKLC